MTGTLFSLGTWVWVPDEEEYYVPGKVLESFHKGEPARLEIDGEILNLNASETEGLERLDEQSLKPLENMVTLKELNEQSLLHNLRMRYKIDEIYTNVGSILVSVNPFKLLPLYTEGVMNKYIENGHRGLPPHVYGVADEAFHSMTSYNRDQACIVSGESGAGKTEATKIFLQYIAEVSVKKEDDHDIDLGIDNDKENEQAPLQEQILKANPLMEAFGNAKTLRNNNSSRFGKWIEVRMDNRTGLITGGYIIPYLLEKSRIVYQALGERNYHIFYNLCAGAAIDDVLKERFLIQEPEFYNYLNRSGCVDDPGLDDENDWEKVLESMQVVGIDVETQDHLIQTIVAILHLGNVDFYSPDGDEINGTSQIENDDMLELVALQLGIENVDNLRAALCKRKIKSGAETILGNNSVEQSYDIRDALAKALYAQMFQWLINRINISLSRDSVDNTNSEKDEAERDDEENKKTRTNIIGILDIFGFESFETNSLEQLCINYCNEKLQFHFNDHIFKLEQNLYKSEGIDVSKIDFKDNQPCLDLFEKKAVGIFSTLDDEMNLPRGNDMGFLKKLSLNNKEHEYFVGPGMKTDKLRSSFTVKHYAGDVMYTVTDFLEKNRDRLTDDAKDVVKTSSVPLIAGLFGEEKEENGGKHQRKKKSSNSLGSKFKKQLEGLMETLNKCDPHFIRCIKPNANKVGNQYNTKMILEQLRCAGILEVCRIRKMGYPNRKEFGEFMRRYSILKAGCSDAEDLCKSLTDMGILEDYQWQIGHSKVFLKSETLDNLEERREVAVKKYTILLQKVIRGFLVKAKFTTYRMALKDLKIAIKSRILDDLVKLLEILGELPNDGRHIPCVVEARMVVDRIQKENRARKALALAIERRDLAVLQAAVNASMAMKFIDPIVDKASELIEYIKKQEKTELILIEAIKNRSLDELKNGLSTAESLQMEGSSVYQQAQVTLKRITEEKSILASLAAAMSMEDATIDQIDALRGALRRASDAGMMEVEAVKDAQVFLSNKITEEEEIRLRKAQEKAREEREKQTKEILTQLNSAIEAANLIEIEEVRNRALEMNIGIEKENELIALLQTGLKILDRIKIAMNEVRSVATTTKIGIDSDDVVGLTSAIEEGRTFLNENKGSKITDIVQLSRTLEHAETLQINLNKQLELQVELDSAVQSGNIETIRELLLKAGELKMSHLEIVELAKSLVRAHKRELEEVSEQDLNRWRDQKMGSAKNDKYDFRNFINIRSDADYTKGVKVQNKKTVAASKLNWQKFQIPNSITVIEDKKLNKTAMSIYKSLLKYCGEFSPLYSSTLAQEILKYGCEKPALRDEIYVQICKHITGNKHLESTYRAWQVMCMAVSVFAPSMEFELHLLNFLMANEHHSGLIGNYARYSRRRLESTLLSGDKKKVLNIEQIETYGKRPPILVTIELIDGSSLTDDMPIHPYLNVSQVAKMCSQALRMSQTYAKDFGIFVNYEQESKENQNELSQAFSRYSQDRRHEPIPGLDLKSLSGRLLKTKDEKENEDLPPRTTAPLRDDDYMGESLLKAVRQKHEVTFVFKRKFFFKTDDQEESDTQLEDPVYDYLMYLQAVDGVVSGDISIAKESDTLLLTAIAIKCEYGIPNSAEELVEKGFVNYLPPKWRSEENAQQGHVRSDMDWAHAIMAWLNKVQNMRVPQCRKRYVDTTKKNPLWGVQFFYVRKPLQEEKKPEVIKEEENEDEKEVKKEETFIIGISSVGIHFLTPLNKQELVVYPYKNILRWGGSHSNFWIKIWDEEKKIRVTTNLVTSQARDISNLILDYATAIESTAALTA